MVVKPEAYQYHFASRPEESTLAQSLGEAFDVTYGDRYEKNSQNYSFWFANPQSHTCERFGLRHEILVVYSQYSNTDGRVLRAIRDIQRDDRFRHRLDPVLVLLIHRGDPVVTNELLYSEEQDLVVVPFSADELFNASRGSLFIRSRIAEYFGEKDLFGMASPLTSDKYFFGRNGLVQELVVRATTRAESSGVFGLRKTGKTSVLRAVERRASKRSVLVEYTDCHNPGIYGNRWWQVLEYVVERLRDGLKAKHKRNARVSPNYSKANAGMQFVSDIQTLIADGNLERVVVMFDEIEYITPKISGQLSAHWDEDFAPFWQTIRSAHHETRGRLVFIVAGVNPLCVQEPQFSDVPNPIFQLAVANFLAPFRRQDVRDMVRFIGRYSGLRFEEDTYDYLREKYGGHPFLIRIACSEVWREMTVNDPQQQAEVTIADFKSREIGIRARLTQPIRDILLSLVWWYPDDYAVLQILAEGDTDFVDQYVQEYPNSIVQFQHYGILKSSGTAEFAIEHLREFIEKNGDQYKEEMSAFRRGDVPPDLLPQVPDIEKLKELFDKRCTVEIKLRQALVTYLYYSEGFDPQKVAEAMIRGLSKRPDRKDPSALFRGRLPQQVANQLYTLDLKSIITANWGVFGRLFDGDKARFGMNMDTINTARNVETHTKPFTASEIEDFNNSYGWILRKLDQVPALSTR